MVPPITVFAIQSFKGGKKKGARLDLVLGCVDNYEARVAINQVLLVTLYCSVRL
jgi:hypothetical protein